ncbi:MAG: DUF2505 domain-containing protein [Deltaproteobacteria bacterium]|nr:DUF2505 domain-containing protein [Deltaproteobacteria bacterium]
MAKQVERMFRFSADTDRLLSVLIDEDYQHAREKAQGALSSKVDQVERTDERLVYKVSTTEYAKGMTGVDKSKTEESQVTYEWDLKRKRAKWTYAGPHGKMVSVQGELRIQPDGDGSNLTSVFQADVKVPLVGGKIEKMILAEVEKSWDRYGKTIQDFLDR